MDVLKLSTSLQNLKEQLKALMIASADLIERNSLIDSGMRQENINQSPSPKFETILEDFLSTCVTIELNLRTMQECLQQGRASHHNLPLTVMNLKCDSLDPKPDIIEPHSAVSYNQYLSTIKYQVETAASLKSLLNDFVSQLNIKEGD